jgi:hypothetical protein
VIYGTCSFSVTRSLKQTTVPLKIPHLRSKTPLFRSKYSNTAQDDPTFAQTPSYRGFCPAKIFFTSQFLI